MAPEVTARHRRIQAPRSRTLLFVAGTLAVLFLAGSVVYAQLGRQAAGAQAQDLAAQIQDACRTGRLTGVICHSADQVAADPVPGPAGPQGAPGSAGPQGAAGMTGATGPPGPAGPQGATGAPGKDGATGAAGTSGKDGADGATGAQGATGPQGPVGPAGKDGAPASTYTLTFADGSTQTCTRSGGPDTDPQYLCAAPVPAP